jgi:quercetin dioxygenase-like cupin family protein
MYIIDEKDLEYRNGDSGPKYLMKGPRMNFAVVQFPPGSDFKAHYHNIMEENFYVLEGEIDIIVVGKDATDKRQVIHVEPEESHYLVNNSEKTARLVATLAPYQASDKVEID